MKILIVSQYFWPENFRINDLTQELVQRGHSVTVLTGIPNYPAGSVFEAYRQDPTAFGHYGGAIVIRVPMLVRGQGALRLILNYLSFVVGGCLCGPWRLRGQQADVIFVFGLSPVTLALPAILLGRVIWKSDPHNCQRLHRRLNFEWWHPQLLRVEQPRCNLIAGRDRWWYAPVCGWQHGGHLCGAHGDVRGWWCNN